MFNEMKSWKMEIIECAATVVFASGAWWWVCGEWQKTPNKTQETAIEKPVKIYTGAWRGGGYLELQRERGGN